MAKKGPNDLTQVRQLFPEVCKWYTPEVKRRRGQAEVAAEVLSRSQRFQEQGVSPCDNCPLCPGEHEH